jgi:hypothetical protein
MMPFVSVGNDLQSLFGMMNTAGIKSKSSSSNLSSTKNTKLLNTSSLVDFKNYLN